jgi:2-polyprenyl-6-methoxyphenol hydroxylase-like FAD-dependent oxidoreductase
VGARVPARHRPTTVPPIGLTWPATPGVTLLGDAAHLMPPAGLGANAAMLDALELALELIAHPSEPDAAVRRYEVAMFERGAAAARESAKITDILMSPRGAQGLLKFFQGHSPEPGMPDQAPAQHRNRRRRWASGVRGRRSSGRG